MTKALPSLAFLRTVLRAGMTRAEFFQACDDMTDDWQLRIMSADNNVVQILVAEGDRLLCFLIEDRLLYAEYQGGVFLESSEL